MRRKPRRVNWLFAMVADHDGTMAHLRDAAVLGGDIFFVSPSGKLIHESGEVRSEIDPMVFFNLLADRMGLDLNVPTEKAVGGTDG